MSCSDISVSNYQLFNFLLLFAVIMGTAILLRSHGSFQNHLHNHSSCSVKSQSNSNSNPRHVSRRKRCFERRRGGDVSGAVVKLPGVNLVMGEVKILKRGEKLSHDDVTKIDEGFDLVLGSTDRLGPDPETVWKHVRVPDLTDGMFAGPTSLASPSPSSVPVPVFLGRKNAAAGGVLRQLLHVID